MSLVDFSSVPIDISQKSHKTSDHYADQAKKFLTSVDVRTEFIKGVTYKILTNIDNLNLPLPGQQFRIRTQTQLNLISILLKIVKQHNILDEVTIATYTLNREALEVLLDLVRSERIKQLNLFIASSYSFRNKDYFEYLKHECPKFDEIHLTFAWLHFKITLIKCSENYYLHEGSMNYSTNNMAEQLLFENKKETYDLDYQMLHGFMTDRNNKALEHIC